MCFIGLPPVLQATTPNVRMSPYIEKQAVIFGRDPNKSSKLTTYHLKINDAAKQLCLQNPELLSDRAKLLELSREKVHEDGYQYRKGTSRSKKLHLSSDEQSAPKRPKISEDIRLRRISELQEDIKDATDQIQIKEKRRDIAATAHQYKDCDRLTSQISLLRQKMRERKSELAQLQKKQRKSTWYRKKRSASDTDVMPSPISPVPSSSSAPSGDAQPSGQFQVPSPLMSPKMHGGQRLLFSPSPVSSLSSLASPICGSTDSELERVSNDTLILTSEDDSDSEPPTNTCSAVINSQEREFSSDCEPTQTDSSSHFQ